MNAQATETGEHVVYAGPAGVRCHPDGRLFVGDDLAHRIVVVHPEGSSVILGGYGAEPGHLLYADAVHWRRDGALLVADTGANRIQVWMPNGRFISQFGRTPTGVEAAKRLLVLAAPVLVVAAIVGGIALAFGLLRSREPVLVLAALGSAAALIWGALSVMFEPGLRNPRDIWVDADDQAYVADFGSDVVRVFDAAGRLVRTIGRPGAGPGELRRPLGVTIDAAGHVLVTDSGNHRVQVFTKAGTFVSSFGGAGREPGRFQSPHGIAVSASGRLFVADRDSRRVQILANDGSPTATIDRATDGSTFTPIGVCVRGNGDLLVSDLAGHRVLTWPAAWLRKAFDLQ